MTMLMLGNTHKLFSVAQREAFKTTHKTNNDDFKGQWALSFDHPWVC